MPNKVTLTHQRIQGYFPDMLLEAKSAANFWSINYRWLSGAVPPGEYYLIQRISGGQVSVRFYVDLAEGTKMYEEHPKTRKDFDVWIAKKAGGPKDGFIRVSNIIHIDRNKR
jgi:hypothetical protein